MNSPAGIAARVAAALVAAAALAGAPTGARADTETVTYTFNMLDGYSSESGTSFAQFDPSLGTLDSVTLNDTNSTKFSGGGGSDDNDAQVEFDLGGHAFFDFVPNLGNGTGTGFIDNYTPNTLPSGLIGTGTLSTSVSVSNAQDTTATVSSTFGIESLTYNYTPTVASVPEPAGFAVLGAGLLGLGLVRRRSR